MYYVYILKSKTRGVYYSGITNNLERRLSQHNSDSSIGTRGKGPYELIYHEVVRTRLEARDREKYFKSYKFRDNREEILKSLLEL